MYRKVSERLREFRGSDEYKALLITGARQVGKTYSIREFGRQCRSFIEINFLENKKAQAIFEDADDGAEILLRLSAVSGKKLIPGETLVFFDEVQECSDIVTAIKFLVEEGSYRYILSGSLLGVELKDVRSIPVGYMDVVQMYPMDFEEFAIANGVSDRVFDSLREAYEKRLPADRVVHEKMMELFRLYLIIGGMPAVVSRYLGSNNIRDVVREQRAIITLYKKDIARYDPNEKLYLEEIFDLIPGELNSKNKRFILKDLNEHFKFSRYSNSFLWLKDAGTALPVYCCSEPKIPLVLSRSTNLFKLFLADVGLLAAMCMDDIQLRILERQNNINFGSIYENAAAQELAAHGFKLFYFNSKKQGELDFMLEHRGEVLPVEIKSGKDYERHRALSNIMSNPAYSIPEAFVFYNDNVKTDDKLVYYPIYMLMFLKHDMPERDIIYKPDLGVLTDH